MNNCQINDYNQFLGVDEFAYNIFEYLFLNETLWKLIKYDGNDALNPSNANLTSAEKIELLWVGDEEDSSGYRVFMQPSTDDAFEDVTTQLRIFERETIPESRVVGTVLMCVEILVYNKNNGLKNSKKTRLSAIKSEVIQSLNGVNIKGVGNLFLDQMGNRKTGAVLSLNNSKNYFGYVITLATHVG